MQDSAWVNIFQVNNGIFLATVSGFTLRSRQIPWFSYINKIISVGMYSINSHRFANTRPLNSVTDAKDGWMRHQQIQQWHSTIYKRSQRLILCRNYQVWLVAKWSLPAYWNEFVSEMVDSLGMHVNLDFFVNSYVSIRQEMYKTKIGQKSSAVIICIYVI